MNTTNSARIGARVRLSDSYILKYHCVGKHHFEGVGTVIAVEKKHKRSPFFVTVAWDKWDFLLPSKLTHDELTVIV